MFLQLSEVGLTTLGDSEEDLTLFGPKMRGPFSYFPRRHPFKQTEFLFFFLDVDDCETPFPGVPVEERTIRNFLDGQLLRSIRKQRKENLYFPSGF